MRSYIPAVTRGIILLMLVSITPVLCSSLSATQKGLTAGGLGKELARIGHYGRERGVIVKNDANDWLRLWCSSAGDRTGEKRLNPGEFLSFSFKPMVMGGSTVFWCTVDFKTYWARWDVFGGDASYGHDNKNDKSYIYEIRNDGVYYKGNKIRGLAGGRYRYTLWDHYDQNKNPFGDTLNGYTDSLVCNNVPNWFEGRVSAVTLCNHACVTLYSGLHCRGQTSKLQARGGCVNFWLGFFNDRTKSLKGC